MIPVLLICIPLFTGIIACFLPNAKTAKSWALLASIATLAVSLLSIGLQKSSSQLMFDASWLPLLGSRFTVSLDGMGTMITLLTAISFPVIFVGTYQNSYQKPGAFYGLMLLSQAGLMGVFCAADLLLFYFFWELALIPVYFLCSIWGGEKRIAVTFKFFIYTFAGSLLMLLGILYVYMQSPSHSFAAANVTNIIWAEGSQNSVFWLFFIAFAIKMPIFPFHTWQPDTYEQAPTAVTMVLSAVMVKMGIFSVIRWLLPMFPDASAHFSHLVILLCVIGMVYASLIAIKQDDVKRLIAYSSIAHIGLMGAAMFTANASAIQGVMFQMFAHGINVIGLWIVADVIEKQTGTRKFSELGGLAQTSPSLAILLVIMALANIALPLTNAFIGEFLMFSGLFTYNVWLATAALVSIILAAVYTLWMVQKVLYGENKDVATLTVKLPVGTRLMLIVLVVVIFAFGVFPQPMINLTTGMVSSITAQIK